MLEKRPYFQKTKQNKKIQKQQQKNPKENLDIVRSLNLSKLLWLCQWSWVWENRSSKIVSGTPTLINNLIFSQRERDFVWKSIRPPPHTHTHPNPFSLKYQSINSWKWVREYKKKKKESKNYIFYIYLHIPVLLPLSMSVGFSKKTFRTQSLTLLSIVLVYLISLLVFEHILYYTLTEHYLEHYTNTV